MIKIYTFAHKRPDFIELQYKSFKKYLQDDFEFIVFNNAALDHPSLTPNFLDKNYLRRQQIDDICDKFGIQRIDIQREGDVVGFCQAQESLCSIFDHEGNYSNPNIACAYPLCWAWIKIISKERCPICILESDMFLTEPIKFSDYIEKYDLCYLAQSRKVYSGVFEYMHSGFVLADLSKLPDPESINWYCGRAKGAPTDVGGQTYRYLETHPDLKILRLGSVIVKYDITVDCNPIGYEYYYLDGKVILHYRSGSNWHYASEEFHAKKTAWLLKRLNL